MVARVVTDIGTFALLFPTVVDWIHLDCKRTVRIFIWGFTHTTNGVAVCHTLYRFYSIVVVFRVAQHDRFELVLYHPTHMDTDNDSRYENDKFCNGDSRRMFGGVSSCDTLSPEKVVCFHATCRPTSNGRIPCLACNSGHLPHDALPARTVSACVARSAFFPLRL